MSLRRISHVWLWTFVVLSTCCTTINIHHTNPQTQTSSCDVRSPANVNSKEDAVKDKVEAQKIDQMEEGEIEQDISAEDLSEDELNATGTTVRFLLGHTRMKNADSANIYLGLNMDAASNYLGLEFDGFYGLDPKWGGQRQIKEPYRYSYSPASSSSSSYGIWGSARHDVSYKFRQFGASLIPRLQLPITLGRVLLLVKGGMGYGFLGVDGEVMVKGSSAQRGDLLLRGPIGYLGAELGFGTSVSLKSDLAFSLATNDDGGTGFYSSIGSRNFHRIRLGLEFKLVDSLGFGINYTSRRFNAGWSTNYDHHLEDTLEQYVGSLTFDLN